MRDCQVLSILEETSVTLDLVEETVTITVDLSALAATMSRLPMETLIKLIDRIDYETADWHFFNALEEWMKQKLFSEVDGEL